jgi:tripartite-type tricarboxylate transporter receptor subunit TctC
MLVDSAHSANPALYDRMPYDTLKDFTALGLAARIPMVLLVNPSLPAKSVRELIALAKSTPGKLNYASAGTGSAIFLVTELFKSATQIDLVQIAYQGGGPALAEVIGGQVPMMFLTIAAAMTHVKAGRVVALGISSLQRIAAYPELPSIAESGVPGFEFHLWQAMIAPAGVMRPIVTRFNGELNAALGNADVKERLSGLGAEVVVSTPGQAAEYIRNEVERWRKTIKPEMRIER